jgi:multicomponent Na+:H+ antiporter subunit D
MTQTLTLISHTNTSKNFIELVPLLSIMLLMMSAFVMPLLKKKHHIYGGAIGVLGLTGILQLLNVLHINRSGAYTFDIGHFPAPFGIMLKIGEVESIIGLLFVFVNLMIVWYAYFSLEKEIKENRVSFFHTLNLLLLASLLGIVYTNDIFNGFVFLEVSTLAACGIIVVKDKKTNIKAGIKYLILSSLGSGLVLMGIAFVYSLSGHLSMSYIHEALLENMAGKHNTILISIILFTIGLGIKGAMFPLHIWLPDAHASAPSPSSAILSALVIKAPILFLIKIYYVVFGMAIIGETVILDLVLLFGVLGMIFGSLFARSQTELKRMIAYSSVAQMGYIFFAIGLGNKLGLIMAVYHIIAHALTKSSLFLAAGSFIEQTGFKTIDEFKGIGKEMPVTLGIFTISALSMIGIPVLPGFISKWNLAMAAIEIDKIYLLIILLVSSLLNAGYYFPIIINGYFGEDNLDGKIFRSKSKPVKTLLPLMILTILMVLAGFFSGSIITFIERGIYLG